MTVTKDDKKNIKMEGEKKLYSLAVSVWPYTGLNNHECSKHSTGTSDKSLINYENTASLF
jgi:hypothetical protein